MDRYVFSQTDSLFDQWAQAYNGRWLSYVLLNKKVDGKGNELILEALNNKMKPIIRAKYRYRALIQDSLGYNDLQTDRYLDSLYFLHYDR